MDIDEDRDDLGGVAQLARILFSRYKSSNDILDKLDALFLLQALALSHQTKDRSLMNRARAKL